MNPLSKILKYILNFKWFVVIAFLCSLGYAGLNGASVYLIGPFMNKLFVNQPSTEQNISVEIEEESVRNPLERTRDYFEERIDSYLGGGTPRQVLTRLCVLIIIVIILKNVFSYMNGFVLAYVEQGVVRNLRNDLYAAYHTLPLRYFQKQKTGDLISRIINDCNTINTNLNNSLVNLLREPISIFVLLFLMVVINWKLTALIFLIAPPSLIIIAKIAKKLRRRTTRTQNKIAAVTSVLEETISGVRIVKAFAMEKFEIGKFKKANYSYFRSMINLFRIRRLASPVTEVLGVSMAVAILWVGGVLVLEKMWLKPEEFIQFLVLMFILMQSGKKLSDVNVRIQVGIAASKRVFDIIEMKSEIIEPQSPIRIETIYEGIRFRNLSYEYESGVPVLSDINLDVKIGEHIALVGPSGAGKSTLVDLLPRFFDPVSGSIEIDGHDLREYKLDDLRCLFGIVTQENILFHDTIQANIAYGRPDIPMDDIIIAAKAANAHDFIEDFENGYDTVVGERGTKLSGGQKQRLVIARAILKNPPALIFDEATSALDSKAEAEVQAAIEHLVKGRTSFIIAHRLSTIQSATRIVVIDNGRIVEQGTHSELYEEGKLYRQLYDIQFSMNKKM